MKKITMLIIIIVTMIHMVYSAKMSVATWLSPQDPHNAIVLPEWKKWIEEATDGRVEVELKYYQGHPKDIFGAVEDGNFEAGWSYHGYLPGKFKYTVMAELPLLGADAEAASSAYWKVYNKYFLKENEHRGLELAALFLHGQGQIMMVDPINGLSDLKNKKIRVGGGVQGFIGKELGVTQVPAPGSKVYEILSQGIADGVFMPIGQQVGLRLSEVTKYIYYNSEGLYLGSFAIFINPDFMSRISKADAKAIRKVSGEKLSKYTGKIWAESDQAGYDKAVADGVKIENWSSADKRKFKRIAVKVERDWLSGLDSNKRGVARKAKQEYQNLARNYKK